MSDKAGCRVMCMHVSISLYMRSGRISLTQEKKAFLVGEPQSRRGGGKLKVIARKDGVGVIGSGHTIQPINPSISIQWINPTNLRSSTRHVTFARSLSAYYCAAVTVSRHYNSVDDVDTLSLRVRYIIPSLLVHYLLLPGFLVVYMWLLLSCNFLNGLS